MITNTCGIIKPDAIKDGHVGEIITMIENKKFIIKNIKLVQFTKCSAKIFYLVHKNKSFYENLCNYISSGPVIAISLFKKNAVFDFRSLIGATDPFKALDGTIRKKFSKSIEANTIHGSDSNENAKIESNFFFF